MCPLSRNILYCYKCLNRENCWQIETNVKIFINFYINFFIGPAMNSIVRSKTFHDIKLNKGMSNIKQKGLSIRSNSDMNISQSSHSVGVKKNVCDNKEQDCMKLKVTQIDNCGRPISPSGKTPGKVIKFVF